MWCVAELNEDYIAKMEDVLATYERPYDPKEPVVCLDEKPVTLQAEVPPARAAAPGREARRDNEYRRCGTAHVCCAVEPTAGRHFTCLTPDRAAHEFAQVSFGLAQQYPSAKTIHLVVDNLNIHCRKSLTDFYGGQPAASSGNASPCITPLSTAVGSTRRRAKSGCSRASAWATAESPSSRLCAAKPAPGLGESIVPGPGSTGASTAGPPAVSSVMQNTFLSSLRPSRQSSRSCRAALCHRWPRVISLG
jgi:DDE superfamily endonuclease